MRNVAIGFGSGVAVAAGGLAVGSALGGGGPPPQVPDPPAAGSTAVASATARVLRPAHETDSSIAAAVADAHRRAIPQAVRKARAEGLRLASAAGARLGPVAAVDETRASPYGAVLYDDIGRYGPGRFCRRHRCYTPHSSTAAFSVTFELRR
jgi:hypothetical protein